MISCNRKGLSRTTIGHVSPVSVLPVLEDVGSLRRVGSLIPTGVCLVLLCQFHHPLNVQELLYIVDIPWYAPQA